MSARLYAAQHLDPEQAAAAHTLTAMSDLFRIHPMYLPTKKAPQRLTARGCDPQETPREYRTA